MADIPAPFTQKSTSADETQNKGNTKLDITYVTV